MSKIFKVGSTIKYNADEIYSALDKALDGFFVVSELVEAEESAPSIDIQTRNPQQPSVPIQFVWHNGCLYHESDCVHMGIGLEENCTVEQIGAVLYVRSKE